MFRAASIAMTGDIRCRARVSLPLIAAGTLLLASLYGCSSAVAPDDSQGTDAGVPAGTNPPTDTTNKPDKPDKPDEPDEPDPSPEPDPLPEPGIPEGSGPPSAGPLRVGVAADAQAVAEGEDATFTVTATGTRSASPVLVDYTVSGTASMGSDYLAPSSTATIDAGAAASKITVETLADNEPEPDETIAVALVKATSGARTVQVDRTAANVTIAESGTVFVSVQSVTAAEADPARFAVTVSDAVSSVVTVQWRTADGTAQAGTDYTAVTGTVTFTSSAARQQTITVTTLHDRLDETDETFLITLTQVSPAAGVSLGRATATGTITDDDDPAVLTIDDRRAGEDAGSMLFTVRLVPASGRIVTVRYETQNVAAQAGAGLDYTATAGELTFRPGQALEQTIVVPIADDSEDEDDEQFKVLLRAPVNATLGDGEAVGTIADNDDAGPHRLDIADSSADEGDGTMPFAVTLNRASGQVVTVFYETNDGTAETHPEADYTKTEGELTFSLGGTLRLTISVPILQDDLGEGTEEEFTVTLLDPVNAELGRSTATGAIQDDDDAPPDDHGDTRATASTVTAGTPVSGRLETAADVDYFRVSTPSVRLLFTATDAGRVGDPGYDADTAVRIETSGASSTNVDNVDVQAIVGVAYVRVSGGSATRYDLAVWLLEPNESDTSFDIELRYLDPQPTAAQKSTFRAAADVWESIVTGDLARRIVIDSGWECEDGDPSAFGDYIDDLRIDIRLERIDGTRGTLASAGPCVSRPGGLPVIGDVLIDTGDLARLGTGGLRRLAVHEMAHVLGYGTSSLWDGLLRNSAVEYANDNAGQGTLPDTHFAGQAARRAFNEVGGDSYTGGQKVPVENDTSEYREGGLDGHWREAVFDTELMTASISINPQTSQPLSKVTIAALADLGYSVDYTQAESFSLPRGSRSLLRVQSAPDEVHLGDHIRRGPVIVVEMPE